MSNRDLPPAGNDAVDVAFARVFAAEREAEQAVADCRRQAEQRLAEARAAAARVAARAEARRLAWQQRLAQRVAAQEAALARESEAASGPVALDEAQRARLAAAAARLAEELSGD